MRGNLDQLLSMFPRIKTLRLLLLSLLLCALLQAQFLSSNFTYMGSEVFLLVTIYLSLGLSHVDM